MPWVAKYDAQTLFASFKQEKGEQFPSWLLGYFPVIVFDAATFPFDDDLKFVIPDDVLQGWFSIRIGTTQNRHLIDGGEAYMPLKQALEIVADEELWNAILLHVPAKHLPGAWDKLV
jgi:hypothetical protein